MPNIELGEDRVAFYEMYLTINLYNYLGFVGKKKYNK